MSYIVSQVVDDLNEGSFDSEKQGVEPIAAIFKRVKRGGRRKGSLNKRTRERQTAIAAIKASGKDPVTFFADLLRNESAPLELRFQAAKELAPFVHPKLSSIEARTGGATHEDRLEQLQRMLED